VHIRTLFFRQAPIFRHNGTGRTRRARSEGDRDWSGLDPTGMGVPGMLVAVSIGVTVPEPLLLT
jgi:hypothetical protein